MTDATVLVRPSGPGDLPAIQAIYAHHVLHGTGTFELDPPAVAIMQRRFHELSSRDYPYIVAEGNGEIWGFGYAG